VRLPGPEPAGYSGTAAGNATRHRPATRLSGAMGGEVFSPSSDTSQGRRIFWGRVATGQVQAGQTVKVLPSGQTARGGAGAAPHPSARIGAGRPQRWRGAGPRGRCLARRLVAGGREPIAEPATDDFDTDTRTTSGPPSRELSHRGLDGRRATGGRPRVLGAAWPPLGQGQGQAHRAQASTSTRWQEHDADAAGANAIGHVELLLQEPIAARPTCPLTRAGFADPGGHRLAQELQVRRA
jgi:sulfate adenylyltransferase subunit 1